MSKNFKENCESLATYWNSKKGLAFFILTFITIYYAGISKFLEDNVFENKLFRIWLIPIIFLILIYLVWAILSYRINLYKKKVLTTGIFLKCTDSVSEIRIKEIIDDFVNEMKDEFIEIKFKLFPINYITTKSQLSRFVANNEHIIDNAFFASIHNGNCLEGTQTVSKIEIQNIFFSGYFDSRGDLDFRNKINISQDLNIRNLNKDWQYVESRSFNDKSKIKHNLKDSLLFFNGLYSIYKKEYDLALKIFRSLKLSENSEDTLADKAKRNRLNEILVGLFTFNAFDKYIGKRDIETAFTLLKECEILFKENHRFSFNNFTALARIYFEKDDLSMAKQYTDKAKELNKFSPVIFCNLGFFGMVENNPEQLFQNYLELAHVYRYSNKLDFLDVVHFIELHKTKFPDSLHLFDFAIGTLNFLYVDKELGRQQLKEVREKIKAILSYSKILILTNLLIEKGGIKSPYYYRDRKRAS